MIVLILFLGLVLRLVNLNQSLWLDEAINVVAVKTYGLKELITSYALGDYHPPLYHPFLWLWVKFFGSSEIVVRIPSVIFGCLTILITYLITIEITRNNTEKKQKGTEPKNIAFLTAFFMAIAPYSIYFSQEARMYALEGLLGTISIYFLLKILNKENIWAWIGYTITVTLAIYVDYFGFFLPLVALFYFLWKKDIFLLKKWALSSLISFLAWLPWLPLFFKQFINAQKTMINLPGWSKVVGGATLKNLALTFVKFSIGRISFENKIFYGGLTIVIFVFFSFLFLKALRIFKNNNKLVLLLWLFGPLIVSFLISFKLRIYQPFRLLYLLPVFYFFLAGGVYSFKKKWQQWLSGGLVTLISLGGLCLYYFNAKNQRENWRGAVEALEQKARTKDLVVFASDQPMSPWIYYQKRNLKAIGTGNLSEINSTERIFLFRYLWPVFDPNDSIRKKIEEKFALVDVKEFNGVEWWEYQRKIINFSRQKRDLAEARQ